MEAGRQGTGSQRWAPVKLAFAANARAGTMGKERGATRVIGLASAPAQLYPSRPIHAGRLADETHRQEASRPQIFHSSKPARIVSNAQQSRECCLLHTRSNRRQCEPHKQGVRTVHPSDNNNRASWANPGHHPRSLAKCSFPKTEERGARRGDGARKCVMATLHRPGRAAVAFNVPTPKSLFPIYSHPWACN